MYNQRCYNFMLHSSKMAFFPPKVDPSQSVEFLRRGWPRQSSDLQLLISSLSRLMMSHYWIRQWPMMEYIELFVDWQEIDGILIRDTWRNLRSMAQLEESLRTKRFCIPSSYFNINISISLGLKLSLWMSLRSVDAQILRRKYQKTLHYKHNGITCMA